jgi:hypothetical protein
MCTGQPIFVLIDARNPFLLYSERNIITRNIRRGDYMAFCSNCGTQYNEGARFCSGCSTPIAAQPMNPGYTAPPQPAPYGGYAPPPQQAPYPGYAPPPQQVIYPNYAPPPQPVPYDSMQSRQRYGRKSKTVAIILAVLFSYWTWLYTFKRDRVKFFAALVLSLAAFAGYYVVSRLSYVSFGISIILWIWPLIDTLKKSSEWYAGY